ncbi:MULTISPECIES: hypothetical protein [unclassified Halomonas]|jgi:hypothetical protein|uniref:hypothetical protein n=1 Tax=unclassified Halomonas TaxID=2609666 RepID=UPI000489F68C|nr:MULTISPECIES: hypothetical protein [unclassified Halomonas]NAO96741.1 hypothetical protein [Halomonas sp. MG34]PKH63307.1 hypothetical protein CXF94_00485 [Halomonas sp. Choline-3u-9]QGQ69954.1 hypothetical protein FDY98_07555 [Halomonas sp. PA16-9]
MAITEQQKTNLLGVTSFMFNFAPDQASFDRFEAIIDADPSFYALGTDLARTEAYTSQFSEGATRAEKIDVILGRLGLEEGSAGYTRGSDFINQRLDDGIPEGQVLMEIGEKLLQETPPEGLEGAAAVLRNKIAVSEAYLESGVEGYSSDTLPTLLANVTADQQSVDDAIEAIEAEAGEGPDVPSNTININFDSSAENEGNFEVNADGELVPQVGGTDNVQTVANVGKVEWDAAGRPVTNSADYTFNLSNQLGEEETYQGLFLSPLLTSESRNTNSQLFIELLDIRAAGTAEPLGNLPIDGIRFNVDGEATVLRSDAIFEAKTYPELLSAIREAIADDSDLAGFTAEIGSSFTATDGGQPIPGAVGSTIILTDAQGREISGGSFTYSDQETGGFTLYGDLSTEAPESVRDLISTNLDLDNVGYGSQGATINLAGQSNSNKGVEEFNVDAENGVWLSQLTSRDTDNNGQYRQHLKEINLTGSGFFNVGQQAATGEGVRGVAELLNAWSDNANNSVELANLDSITGLVDVEKFNGLDFDGDVKLNSYITEDVIARDLDAQDDEANPADDNVNYNYQTAGGDDQISLVVQEDVLQREDALLNINAGNGDNVVETVIVDADGAPASIVNQQLNQDFGQEQVTISTGTGEDVVRTWGAGDATISTGAGNDVIYADNSGLISLEDGSTPLVTGATDINGNAIEQVTRWEFNSTANGALPTGVSNSAVDLSNGANGVAQTFNAFKLQVQVSFKGFESVWVDVPHSETQTTALQVNQAIKDAVNNDAVLQNLIEANDGNGNILDIVSLIDEQQGLGNLDDLSIDFRGPLAAGANNPTGRPQLTADESNPTAQLGAIQDIYNTDDIGTAGSTVGEVDGVASSVESDNVINAGTGNDVIVLGTGEFSNDTVKIDGVFDRDSIVNFESGDATNTGYDILDFTSLLGGASNFAGGVVDNRGIEIDTYAGADYARDGVNWVNLNAADVAARFEDQASTTVATDSVLLVQDGGATGQYKAFHLSSSANSDDFDVNLLGILDFGETQTFDAANFA